MTRARTRSRRGSQHADTLRGIVRALSILRAMNDAGRVTVLELSRITRISRTAVYRIIDTLEAEGYVHREPNASGYRLSASLRELCSGIQDDDWITEAAAPILSDLQRAIVWPTDLATYDNGKMRLRDTTRGSSPLVFDRAAVGWQLPVLHTALGLAYVSNVDPATLKSVLKTLRKSRNPLDSIAREPGTVSRLIQITRKRGYATRHSGFFPNTNSIAVPVMGRLEAIGSVGITFVASALTAEEAASRYLSQLNDAARLIRDRVEKTTTA